MLSKDTLAFLELFSSKICHDLISPVGAVNNGIEILRDMGSDDDAVDIIGASAKQAQDKLQFYRMSYGMSGYKVAQGSLLNEAKKICEHFIDSNKFKLLWFESETNFPEVKPVYLKLLLNVFILVIETLPKGGEIKFSYMDSSKKSVKISTKGDMILLNKPSILPLMNDGEFDISVDTIQACLVKSFLSALNINLRIVETDDGAEWNLFS